VLGAIKIAAQSCTPINRLFLLQAAANLFGQTDDVISWAEVR
jgi:hypothetical protein